VLQQQALAAGDALGGDRAIQVFPYRTGKFRLAAVGDQYVGVEADAGEGAIEKLSFTAAAGGSGGLFGVLLGLSLSVASDCAGASAQAVRSRTRQAEAMWLRLRTSRLGMVVSERFCRPLP
jgi:hypothetical protein